MLQKCTSVILDPTTLKVLPCSRILRLVLVSIHGNNVSSHNTSADHLPG
jgi:hypothetical protein